MFACFVALDPTLFTLNVPRNHEFFSVEARRDRNIIDTLVDGLAASILSLKQLPVIRYQRNSEISQMVANDVWRLAREQEPTLFDYGHGTGSLHLLILDRKDDPVTPLLSQWTYQAMVHELLCINNNRVLFFDSCGKSQDLVLSSSNDEFFSRHMHSNFGDLGFAVKKLVDDFQSISRSNKNLESIEDIQRFVESFPEFRVQSGAVSKHVTILTELSKIISSNDLLAVSQVEQEVVCGSDRLYAYNSVMQQLVNPRANSFACLKLVLLFILRYETSGCKQVNNMVSALQQRNIESSHVHLVTEIVKYAGNTYRTGDLFRNGNFFSRASKLVGGLKGAENVYTQHQPLLVQTLEAFAKGKSRDEYPSVSTEFELRDSKPPQHLLVFIIGGVTYEEARYVAQVNEANQGFQVTLGGTSILNSKMFVRDLTKALCFKS